MHPPAGALVSTVGGATEGLLVLAAGGLVPALALTRLRLALLPVAPLCGAVLASLAVTAMAAIGWSVLGWYVTLSVVGAVVSAACWWRFPAVRPWGAKRWSPNWGNLTMNLAAGLCGLGVTVICLSVLKSQIAGYDTRDIWLMHPLWYLQGHATTDATLRNAVYSFGHPPYPPLVGGSVALTWAVTGTTSFRLGVVMITLLNALAIFAAATAMVEVAGRLASTTTSSLMRTVIRVAGVAATAGVMVAAYGVAAGIIANGYADMLWSAAAVGAVAYGLMLPVSAQNLGAACILASVAGLTKLEGTVTAVAIVALIALRFFLTRRSEASGNQPLFRALALAVGSWAVIGAWPVVIRLLGARGDVAYQGARHGTDASRLATSLHTAFHISGIHFVLIGVGVLVSIVGTLWLRRRRGSVLLGNDLWAWVAICLELVVIFGAYAVGPGRAANWVAVSIKRTTAFPLLQVWWIAATWALLAVRGEERTGDAPEDPAARPVVVIDAPVAPSIV